MCVLVRVSIPAQTSQPRNKLGRKGFIQLTVPHCCSSLKEVRTGTQAGQEAGAAAEAMKGCYFILVNKAIEISVPLWDVFINKM